MIDHRSLSWRENVVVSWTGHARGGDAGRRGRYSVDDGSGEPFPERATIQAIAFVVAVGTLLLQGWTLPPLIRRLEPAAEGDDRATSARRR